MKKCPKCRKEIDDSFASIKWIICGDCTEKRDIKSLFNKLLILLGLKKKVPLYELDFMQRFIALSLSNATRDEEI